MTTSGRRIPLNPCDYLIYGKHRALVASRQGGNIAYMMIDAQGQAPPDRVRDALASAMDAHPVTLARLKFSILGGRPYWALPSCPGEASDRAAQLAYVFDDLRGLEDWRGRLDQLCQARYAADWDLAGGPQVRLEHYALPEDGTRFCIRWPHCLMDAEGAQLFLAEIGACSCAAAGGKGGQRPSLERRSDDRPIDVLAGRSWGEKVRMFGRGLALQRGNKGLAIRPPIDHRRPPFTEHRSLHRHFGGHDFRRLQDRAKKVTPAGPALYARYLAACVIRALHRIYAELGIDTEAYLITLPMRVTLPDEHGNSRGQGLVPGNYLVSSILCVRRQQVADKHALGDDILRQLEDYRHQGVDLIQWSMLWMASFLRPSLQRILHKLPLGFENLSSGFSYYGEIADSVSSIAGADVTNVYGGGPVPSPPGWNPVFSRFRDRLSLSLTWNRPAIPDDLAHRYADLIEQEVLE